MINPSENVNGHRSETTFQYDLENIHPMDNHPFGVRDDEEMAELTESIRRYGVLDPIIVRKRPGMGGGYEIVSGHRRYEACRRLGKKDIPLIVRDLTDEEAILTMVDSNLHREHILPSEKAFAYKMKLDAIKHQGKTLSQDAIKSDSAAEIGAQSGESRDMVFRYIRLTNLVPELLSMVDAGRIALTPAVELSRLTTEEQKTLVSVIEMEQATPNLSQSIILRKLSEKKALTEDLTIEVMERQKANQVEKVSFRPSEMKKFFPSDMTADKMKEVILSLLVEWKEREERRRDRSYDDAR